MLVCEQDAELVERLLKIKAKLMAEAVRVADGLARPGDTVLMAPAAASMDQFRSYAARGDAFIEAVAGLMREHGWDVHDDAAPDTD